MNFGIIHSCVSAIFSRVQCSSAEPHYYNSIYWRRIQRMLNPFLSIKQQSAIQELKLLKDISALFKNKKILTLFPEDVFARS